MYGGRCTVCSVQSLSRYWRQDRFFARMLVAAGGPTCRMRIGSVESVLSSVQSLRMLQFVLYCITLYYIVLHCIILYYIVLYCIIISFHVVLFMDCIYVWLYLCMVVFIVCTGFTVCIVFIVWSACGSLTR